MIKIIPLIFSMFFLSSCFSLQEEKKKDDKIQAYEPGSIPLNYYADKTVKSLTIPPDLTQPNFEESLRISEYVSGIEENFINFSDSEKVKDKFTKILAKSSDVIVQKTNNRKWLLIKKEPDQIWEISKDFFKNLGFPIKKSNKKIGIMETDFVENYEEIPSKNLGFIRGYIQKALAARYSLPIIDKYRVRIEPTEDNFTEFHLSLFSMQEKLAKSGNIETTIWEPYEKDVNLETEMLYQFMLFLSGDEVKARQKIVEAKEQKKTVVSYSENYNGFAKLLFNSDMLTTWDNMSWALDQMNIDIEDKDIKEKSFYLNLFAREESLLTRLLGNDALIRTYQILLKEVDKNNTEVIFNDVSGENEIETKNYSHKFFKKIQQLF